jgi:hypothetical protein
VSMGDDRGERRRETRSADRRLDRRNMLSSTALAVASAFGAAALTGGAQAQTLSAQRPNILFMLSYRRRARDHCRCRGDAGTYL